MKRLVSSTLVVITLFSRALLYCLMYRGILVQQNIFFGVLGCVISPLFQLYYVFFMGLV